MFLKYQNPHRLWAGNALARPMHFFCIKNLRVDEHFRNDQTLPPESFRFLSAVHITIDYQYMINHDPSSAPWLSLSCRYPNYPITIVKTDSGYQCNENRQKLNLPLLFLAYIAAIQHHFQATVHGSQPHSARQDWLIQILSLSSHALDLTFENLWFQPYLQMKKSELVHYVYCVESFLTHCILHQASFRVC